MRSSCVATLFCISSLLLACSASSDDGAIEDTSEDLSGSPSNIAIGFNGPNDQWGYYEDFQKIDTNKGPRLCHTYVSYGVGLDPAEMGDGKSAEATRPYLEYWLKSAEGHCDEALIALKALNHHAAPDAATFEKNVEAFANTNWRELTGFTGKIVVSPWNEPNNPGDAGNGLGVEIHPDLAARYYLAAEKACAGGKCDVVAGDFATNGTMWEGLSWNCADDNVAEGDLCKQKSSANSAGSPASYLDVYKNTINAESQNYGLGKNYRPKVMAYHGWHDENEFLKSSNNKCESYEDCAVRRLTTSLGGSWGGVEIWDTEDGVSQDISSAVPEPEFARGAAFMLCLHAKVSRRITRIYYTRLHRGSGELLDGHTPRNGAVVLAKRESSASGFQCE